MERGQDGSLLLCPALSPLPIPMIALPAHDWIGFSRANAPTQEQGDRRQARELYRVASRVSELHVQLRLAELHVMLPGLSETLGLQRPPRCVPESIGTRH